MTTTPTLAAGNKQLHRGFTLVELLVVLAIVAVAAVGVQWGWSGNHRQLQRDAEQLAQWLEVARADARAQGQVALISWNGEGISSRVAGLPTRPFEWRVGARLKRIDSAQESTSLQLPPEPVMPAIRLRLQREGQQLDIASDGFAPFAVVAPDPS